MLESNKEWKTIHIGWLRCVQIFNYNIMWIRSQDKEMLMQSSSFLITRNYGGKLKFAIVCSIAGTSNVKVVGLYKTKSEALQELEIIQKYLESGDTGVYQVN